MRYQGREHRQPDAGASLEDQRKQWLAAMRNKASKALEPALKPDATPVDARQAIAAVHSIAAENMDMIERNAQARRLRGAQLPMIACKKGCDYCCSIRVRPTIPEVLNIAAYIRDTFTDEQIIALKQRIKENLAAFEGLTGKDRLNKMQPCALLVDHACSVHSVRPVPCRAHHSVDVEACKRGLLNPDRVQIPHFLEVDTVIAPVVEGLYAAVASAGLHDDGVVLVPALDVALNEPNARERWLSGEDVFVRAVDPELNALAAGKQRPQ